MNKEHIWAQILLRSWPFPQGNGRLTDKLFGGLTFSEQLTNVRTSDGFDLHVMPNELIGRHLYLTGAFDRSIALILCNFAEPGDTLLDIGANIGYMSACFLTKVVGSRVVAVEPQPQVLDLLGHNLRQFEARAAVYPYALSDVDGEAFFAIDPSNRGGSRLSNAGVRVETRTADSLFRDVSLTRLDVVKIDVEGHEEEVLRSCRSHFERLVPKLILFEERGDKSASSIGDLMRSMHYSVYGVKKSLTRIELQPVLSARDCNHNDYVAISTDRKIPSKARKIYQL